MEPVELDINTFLVASIHDMKNSLTIVNALLEHAVKLADDPCSPASKQLGQALYESQRVNDNLIQLVTLYKINQQFYPFDPMEHDIEELSSEVLTLIAPLAALRGVQLSHSCPPELSWHLDHELIFGAVIQALRNGMRYARSKVHLHVKIDNEMLKFSVEDDGPGYPAAMLLTAPQPNQGINFASGSTGLGLYFSNVVAQLHQYQGRSGSTLLENGGKFGGGVYNLILP